MDPSILALLETAAASVLGPTEVILAYAYGSRVHGQPRAGSDLDVGYYLRGFPGAAPLPLRTQLRLIDELSVRVGLEVDLRDLGRAPPDVRGRVLEEGIRIYCPDEVARVTLERDLLSRYLDCKESYRRMHELRLKAFALDGV